MRQSFAVFVLLAAASAFAQDAIPSESLLRRGLASYKTRDYASAVTDLQAAAQGFLTLAQTQAYVNTGKFEGLPSLETSLVYLALAQFHLGLEDDARETLLRLQSAERITPTYASLSIGNDAPEVESLASALMPSNPLPHNIHVAAGEDQPRALPPVSKKKTLAEERAERQQIIDEIVGRERDYRMVLRTADAASAAGNLAEAARLYVGIASATAVPREVLAEAAVGLYRTGAFREAADAFHTFGTFAKGEEDLRYYNAVSLYEAGQYAEAQKELACALPFIEMTDDVARYRMKIEGMVAQSAR